MELTGGMIMKKQFVLIAAAVAALFAVSCVKENPVENAPVQGAMKEVTITATIDEATKTSYDAEGVFSWTKGDKIAIKGSDNVFYTFTTYESAPEASFTGSIPEGVELQKHALYPAESASCESGAYYYTIPEFKDLSKSFSPDIPMSSYVSAGTYNFKHMTGAALLTFTNILDKVTVVDISIKSTSLRLSGTQQVWSGAPFTFSAAETANDSEKTFTRRVSVKNNAAQVYLPYNGEFWDKCTVNIKGYDAQNNEYVLLKDKTMKGSSANVIEPAVVIPYTPLELPEYIPEVDWSKVDWDAESVATSVLDPSSNKVELTELKATSDEYYIYFRVKALGTFTGTTFDYYIAGGEGTDKAHDYWNTTVATKIHYQGQASSSELTVKYNDTNYAETKTEVVGDDIYWSVAFPRNSNALTQAAGTVYLGVYSLNANNGWGCVGAIPTRYTELMPVVLN